MGKHHYQVDVEWTGNRGAGTSGYRDYERSHVISAAGKPSIAGSSDPAFRRRAAASQGARGMLHRQLPHRLRT